MEEKKYNIGRLTYFQRELTWGQDKQLSRLLLTVAEKAAGTEEMTMKALPTLLSRHDLLGEFWGIVLHRKKDFWWLLDLPRRLWRCIRRKQSWRYVALDGVTNTALGEMFDDFFFQNRAFLKKLSSFGNALGLVARAAMEMKQDSSGKTSASPEEKSRSKPPSNAK